MNDNELLQKIKDLGFTDANFIDSEKIAFLPEVRGMCKQNRCGVYGKKWSCPPYCGELSECEAKVRAFKRGIVMMTATKLEDSFDIEGMQEAQKVHQHIFLKAIGIVKGETENVLPLAPGGCQLCEKCTCPDEPCRHPDMMYPSMESYGMMVNTVCAACNVSYFNGPETVTYVSAIFF